MTFQRKRAPGTEPGHKKLPVDHPLAEWDETDQRYYMPGEKATKGSVVTKAR